VTTNLNDTPSQLDTIQTGASVTGWTDGLGVVLPRNPAPIQFVGEDRSPPKKRRPKKEKTNARSYVLSTNQSYDGVPKLNLKLKKNPDSQPVLVSSDAQAVVSHRSMQPGPGRIEYGSQNAFQPDQQYEVGLISNYITQCFVIADNNLFIMKLNFSIA